VKHTTPEVGLHRGISADDYFAWDAVNASLLKPFTKSAAHVRQAMIEPRVETDAQALGQATHTAILEPSDYEARFITAPFENRRRLKRDEAEWQAFDEAARGKTVLRPSEDAMVTALSVSARDHHRHPLAASLLATPGLTEASALWIDPATELRCKGRMDKIVPRGKRTLVVDVKTTVDASPRAFSRDIAKFGYHIQAAYYIDGLYRLHPALRSFVFIVIEKSPPYCVAVYEIDDATLTLGRNLYQQYLSRFKACLDADNWPGYPNARLSVPSWAFYEDSE